jgi:hypothetical protein
LGAAVGDFDFEVAFVSGESGGRPVAVPVGQAFSAGAEQVPDPDPDPVERIGFADGPRPEAG